MIDEEEAATVRMSFERFVKVGSDAVLARQINAEGVMTRTGRPIDKGVLYKLLNNQTYVGMAAHKGVAYPGKYEAIVSRDLWDKVHAILQESPRPHANKTRRTKSALLRGLLFAATGLAMAPTHTRRKGKLYRYYVTTSVLKRGPETCPVRHVSAAEIETAVIGQLRGLLRSPEIIVRTWRAAKRDEDITEEEAREACERLDPLWGGFFRRAGAYPPAFRRTRRCAHRRRCDSPAHRGGLRLSAPRFGRVILGEERSDDKTG